MGWRQFNAWIGVLDGIRRREARRSRTDPDSWTGEQADEWWDQARAANRRARGR